LERKAGKKGEWKSKLCAASFFKKENGLKGAKTGEFGGKTRRKNLLNQRNDALAIVCRIVLKVVLDFLPLQRQALSPLYNKQDSHLVVYQIDGYPPSSTDKTIGQQETTVLWRCRNCKQKELWSAWGIMEMKKASFPYNAFWVLIALWLLSRSNSSCCWCVVRFVGFGV
jgi:hypothetical protein